MKRLVALMGIILVVSILVYFILRYFDGYQKLEVSDIDVAQRIVLSNTINGNVYGISIVVSGYIDGRAKVLLLSEGKEYQSEVVSDNFSIRFGDDWYSDMAELQYVPQGVKKGKILVKYKFRTL